ncbi:MAG: LLM class flavin-dependent oxidoreductase [Pseudomonadota bacterium]
MTEPGSRVQLGYLLPTREQVMAGQHDAASLLALAVQAAAIGVDSLWVGDSLIARPRHDPLTLLAGLATRIPRVQLGTAVLLPALRNPVLLAQQLATIDQLSEGRLVVGAGIAADAPSIRAEFAAAGVPFEKRVGRLLEGFRLCRALWQGEPVNWDGRWSLQDASLAPVPHRPGGPPIWLAASVPAGIRRAAKHFDGWFPIGPDADAIARGTAQLAQDAAELGRGTPTVAVYLTLCIDDDAARAQATLDAYLTEYYALPAQILRSVQACYGGSLEGALDWLRAFVAAGAQHLVLRIVGDAPPVLESLIANRAALNA